MSVCPKCRLSRAVTNPERFKLTQTILGPTTNLYGLLSMHNKRNRIIALDYMGPLRITRSLYSSTELKAKHPTLPKDWETIKIWLSVKVCILTNIVDISIVPELTTSLLIPDLKNYMARTGKI